MMLHQKHLSPPNTTAGTENTEMGTRKQYEPNKEPNRWHHSDNVPISLCRQFTCKCRVRPLTCIHQSAQRDRCVCVSCWVLGAVCAGWASGGVAGPSAWEVRGNFEKIKILFFSSWNIRFTRSEGNMLTVVFSWWWDYGWCISFEKIFSYIGHELLSQSKNNHHPDPFLQAAWLSPSVLYFFKAEGKYLN